MARLHRLLIEKSALEALPDRELSILLGGGKILNEMNVSTKYLTFCMNALDNSSEGPEKSAAFTALSFFLRILAGHVFEAYEFFRKVVRVDELRKSTSSLPDTDFFADIETSKDILSARISFRKCATNLLSILMRRFCLSPLRLYQLGSLTKLCLVRTIRVIMSFLGPK
jgi:hypothetical protein